MTTKNNNIRQYFREFLKYSGSNSPAKTIGSKSTNRNLIPYVVAGIVLIVCLILIF